MTNLLKIVPNWVIVVITVLVFAVAFGGSFFLGNNYGVKTTKLTHTEQTVESLEKAAEDQRKLRELLEAERGRLRTVSDKLQLALQNQGVVNDEVITNIVKEIEKPVYVESALPASGVRVLSESADKFNATRRPTKN